MERFDKMVTRHRHKSARQLRISLAAAGAAALFLAVVLLWPLRWPNLLEAAGCCPLWWLNPA